MPSDTHALAMRRSTEHARANDITSLLANCENALEALDAAVTAFTDRADRDPRLDPILDAYREETGQRLCDLADLIDQGLSRDRIVHEERKRAATIRETVAEARAELAAMTPEMVAAELAAERAELAAAIEARADRFGGSYGGITLPA